MQRGGVGQKCRFLNIFENYKVLADFDFDYKILYV